MEKLGFSMGGNFYRGMRVRLLSFSELRFSPVVTRIHF